MLKFVYMLLKKIDFDFVFYDKFGVGELVCDYLWIFGIVLFVFFLMLKECLVMMFLYLDLGILFKFDEKV